MFKPMFQAVMVTGIAAVATSQSSAVIQSSSEVWVGSSSTIQGNGGSGSKVSLFAQRQVLALETAGMVSSIAGITLTDTNSTWTDSQYGNNGAAAYVEFNNGWMADIADCSAANHTLTLGGSLGGAVAVGDSYRIRKHFTIASMFGANNEAGLKSGLNPTSSDNILLLVPETQQTITVFFYDDGVNHAWLRSDFTRADNFVINPEQGVMVRRRTTGDVGLYLVGPTKIGQTVVTIDSGYNLVGTLKSASSLPLTALNLYTGNAATGLASGLNPTTSDNLLVVQPNGVTKTYFYYYDGTNAAWLDSSFNIANTAQIAPGTAFFIHRRAANAAFNWTMSAE